MKTHDTHRPPLPAMAFEICQPYWIGARPVDSGGQGEMPWQDTGPGDVSIKILRGGLVIFDFPHSANLSGGEIPSHQLQNGEAYPEQIMEAQAQRKDLMYRRLEYMNAFLMTLYSALAVVGKAGAQVQPPVDPTSYGIAEGHGERWQIFMTGPGFQYPPQRQIMSLEACTHALEQIRMCHAAFGPVAITMLALTYAACYQYSRHQFSSAHLVAWSVIELQTNVLWSKLLSRLDKKNGGQTEMNRHRRDLLTGRDYTASIVTQMLSLHGEINDEELAALDAARRKRNAFAHALEPVSANDAGKAIRTATDLMSRIAKINVASHLSLGFIL